MCQSVHCGCGYAFFRILFMKKTTLVFFLCSLLLCSATLIAHPLRFVQNNGQWQNQIKYQADIQNGRIFFTGKQFRYVFFDIADLNQIHVMRHEDQGLVDNEKIDCYAYDMFFLEASESTEVVGIKQEKYYHNYFIGNDPAKWAGKVPVFEALKYKNVYDKIDVDVYSQQGAFKYDYIVKPGAKASDIHFAYEGISPTITNEGYLKFEMPFMTVSEASPYTYQLIDGEKKQVAARFVSKGNNSFGIEILEAYDESIELIIDPTLIFATYSGSAAMTFGFSATYGPTTGYLYAGGECFSAGWPVTTGAYQLTFGGSQDAGINVYNALGTALIYSTYFGGGGTDLPNNMIVNDAEELAVCGSTSSTNLPITAGCYDNSANGGRDLYVVKFNSTGTAILGSTYVGGSGNDGLNTGTLSPNYGDSHRGEIFYDAAGNLLVSASTESSNFPVTPGAYQSTLGGQQDGCVFRLSPNCAALLQSTYLGGSGNDACFSIALNSLSDVVVCGGTSSTNFPTTAGAYAAAQPGSTDGFVSILSANLSVLKSSTYLGTTGFDHAFKIQVDNTDSIFICGQTNGNFPVSPGAYTDPSGGTFIAVMNPTASNLVRSTRIGANMSTSSANVVPAAFLKDNCGNIYFSGYNGPSTGLATTANAIQTTTGGFWLSVLDQSLNTLVYATYFATAGDHIDGGTSRFDPQGVVYQSVCCGNNTFPVTPGVFAPTKNAGAAWDVASYKIDFELSGVQSSFTLSPTDTGCAPFNVTFNNNSQQGVTYMWYFGDGDSSAAFAPSHVYTTAGTFTVMLIARNVNSCVEADTAYTTIVVRPEVTANFTLTYNLGCKLDTVHFQNIGQGTNPATTNYAWNYGDGNSSNLVSPTHIYGAQNIYNVRCIADDGFCRDTFNTNVDVRHPIDAGFDVANDSICLGDPLTLVNTSSAGQLFPTPNLFTNTWDMGDGNSLIQNNPAWVHTYQNPGIYNIQLMIMDTLGCIDSFSRKVFVDDSTYASFSASPSMVCLGEYIQFTDLSADHTLSKTYDFDDGTILIGVTNPKYTYQNAGVYDVTFTANYLVCPPITNTITVTVDEYPLVDLGPDTAYCPGMTAPLVLRNNQNPNQILNWNDGTSAPSLQVTEPGRYWASASNGSCKSTDSIWVKRDCYLNIPNSFSPNGDGLNDFFMPRQLLSAGLREFSMKIFNRWGEMVFETNRIDGRGWDGRFGGKDQAVGVYVYTIDAQWNNMYRNTFTGNFTLMR